jgi:hypothetical protein
VFPFESYLNLRTARDEAFDATMCLDN